MVILCAQKVGRVVGFIGGLTRRLPLPMVVALSLLVGTTAMAQTWTQTNAGTWSWNDSTKWSAAFPNAVGATANLNAGLGGSVTINLNQLITVGTVNFSDPNFSYTIAPNGGSLTLDVASGSAAINVAAGSVDQFITADLLANDALLITQSSTAGTLGLSGNVNLNGKTLTVTGAGNTSISGSIYGAASSLTKSGAGTLTLSGSNGYTGNTTITGGVLALSGSGRIGNTVLGINGGTFNVNGAAATITALVLGNATGTLSSNIALGGGSLALSSNVTYTGGATANIDNGTLLLNGSKTFGVVDGTNANDLVISASIQNGSAAAALTKTGAGRLLLTGSNGYTGNTTVTQGVLGISGSGRLSAGALGISNANVELNGLTATFSSITLGASTATLSSNLLTGGGTVALTGNVNTSGGPQSSIQDGVVLLNASRTFTVADGSDANDLVISSSIQNGTAASGLSKAGAGRLLLTGSNGYTGNTTVSAGVLAISGSGRIANSTLALVGGNVELNGGSIAVTALTFGASTATVSSNLLTAGGTINLGGNITNSGGPQNTIQDGTINLLGNRTITVTKGTDGSGVDLAISSSIADGDGTPRMITKTGTGTLVLSGASSYTGTSNFNQGTTIVNGTGGSIAGSMAVSVSNQTVLRLDNSGGVNSNRIGDNAIISLSNGTLQLIGGSTAVVEATGTTIANYGASTINVTKTGGVDAGLDLQALTRTLRGSTVNFTGDGAVRVLNPSLSNGVIGGWAFINGSDFATVNGSNTVTVATGVTKSSGDTWLATDNLLLISSPTAATSNSTINTLKLAGPANVNLYKGLTLNVAAQGVLVTSDGASMTGGSLTTTPVGSNDDLVFNVSGTNTFTLGSNVTNLGATSVSLTKVGAGTLVLDGAKSYTGTTTLSEGAIRLSSDLTLAGGLVMKANSTLNLANHNLTVGALSSDDFIPSITINLGTGTLTTTSASSVAFQGDITGAGSVVKAGSGSWTIGRNLTYTGSTLLTGGQIVLQGSGLTSGALVNSTDINLTGSSTLMFNNGSSNYNDRVNDAAALKLNNGHLLFQANSSGNMEIIGQLQLLGGANFITSQMSANATSTGALVFANTSSAALTRAAGSTVLFRGNVTGTGGTLGVTSTGPRVYFASGVSNSNDIVGGWAYVQTFQNGVTDFANYDATLGIRELSTNGAARPTQVAGSTATQNVLTGVNAQTTLTGTTTINSLNVNSDTTTLTSNLGGFGLVIGSGGLIHSGTCSYIISNGSLTAGATNAPGELIVFSDSNSTIDIQANVVNNGSGALSLVKSGAGTVTLNGAKSFTGTLFVNQGTLTTSAANVIADLVDVVVNNGTLTIGSTENLRSVTMYGGTLGGSGTLTATNGYNIYAGTVSKVLGGANVSLTKNGDGALSISSANSYTGDTVVNGGQFIYAASNILSDSSRLVVNGGLVNLGIRTDTVRGLLLSGGTVTASSGILTAGTANFVVESGDLLGVSLAGANRTFTKQTSGAVTVTGSNTYTGTNYINGGTLSVSADNNLGVGNTIDFGGGVLEITGISWTTNSHPLNFTSTGVINVVVPQSVANSQYAWDTTTITGAGTLNKIGEGTMVVSGTSNSFSGAARVDNGVFELRNSTGLGTGSLTLNNDATLRLNNTAATLNTFLNAINVASTGNNVHLAVTGTSVEYTGSLVMNAGSSVSINTASAALKLTGNFSGNGTITIEGGSTVLMNAGANPLTGSVNVYGTLGGKGSTTAAVNVLSNGAISPGNSIDTLTVGSATFAGSDISNLARLDIELAAAGVADKLVVTGVLDLTSMFDQLNILNASLADGSDYIIASYGSLLGTLNAFNLPANYTIDYNYNGLNEIALVAASIPEPTTLTTLSLTTALALLRPRRRPHRR